MPDNKWEIRSMRTKLLSGIFIILGLSISVSMLQISYFQKSELLKEAHREAESTASTLKTILEYQMINKSPDILQKTLEESINNGQLLKICIIGKGGRINFSSDIGDVGEIIPLYDERCSYCHGETNSVRTFVPSILIDDNGKEPFLRSISPIWNKKECYECHQENKKILGIFLTEKPVTNSFKLIKAVEKRILLSVIFSWVFIIAPIYFLTERVLNRRIRKLIEWTREIRKGNYSAQIDIKGKDELKELAESFKSMSENIKKNIEQIKIISTQLNILYSIVNRLSKTINLNELKVIIIDVVSEILDTSSTILITKTNDEKIFDVSFKNSETVKPQNLQYHIDDNKAPLPSILSESHFSILRKNKPSDVFFSENKHIAYIPLGMREMKPGMLIAARDSRTFSKDETELINALKTHTSVAFENAYLYSVAITDELTGLFTLRHFHTRLEEQVSKFNRYGQKFSLMMLDIDDFKKINDTYGHPAGDSVLAETAKTISLSIRDIDLAFRYGGEEFAVILPETGGNAASFVAERIRKNIAETLIKLDGHQDVSVTLSIGVAACPANGITMKDIVITSDQALYKAKNGGKNRVSLSEGAI